MAQIDTFGAYVRSELDHWGQEFALHRDFEYLGYTSKNMLQVLIEHRGEMPPPNVGYKPFDTDPRAQLIEDIVAEIARDRIEMACALRGYYCGTGRRKVERYETAILLIASVQHMYGALCPSVPNVHRYMRMVEIGTAEVRGVLLGMARAA